MASDRKVAVWMLARVRGEDGEALPARTRQEVSPGFARSLIGGNRAEPYEGQNGEDAADSEDEGDDEEDAELEIPGGFPAREALAAAGIETLDAIPTTVEELTAIDGIGEGFARRILEALQA